MEAIHFRNNFMIMAFVMKIVFLYQQLAVALYNIAAERRTSNVRSFVSSKKQSLSDSGDDNNNIYLLQLGCYPVAVVILHVNKTLNWLLLNLSWEGYMRSM